MCLGEVSARQMGWTGDAHVLYTRRNGCLVPTNIYFVQCTVVVVVVVVFVRKD